ncbi:Intraflagellar transport protein -like protein [Trichinella pseudospiralis]|uniref:Intraflagellar transport protein-like protein n=1 Tax=Trichinella pseudospiralis TaxID=6337 RepID=A0A0V1INA3_TRIPS|nr:Intraflagellar transport protein -like protein [Trichinella pseudospiralis]
MAQFNDKELLSDERNEHSQVVCFDMHLINNIVAVSLQHSSLAEIQIFDFQGSRLDNGELKLFSEYFSILQWHPTITLLAFCETKRKFGIFNIKTKEIFTASSNTDAHTNIIQWSESGNILFFSTLCGDCFVYGISDTGKFHTLITVIRLEDVSQCTVSVEQFFSKSDDHDNDDISDKCLFFVGGSAGIIYALFDHNNFENCYALKNSVGRLLISQDGRSLIAVTEDLFLTQFTIDAYYKLTKTTEVKLSFRSKCLEVTWAGQNLLAFCSGENVVRFWNVALETNSTLSISDCPELSGDDKIYKIAYSSFKETLAVGTSNGKIILWRQKQLASSKDECHRWYMIAVLKYLKMPSKIQLSKSHSTFAVSSNCSVCIYNEQPVLFCSTKEIIVVQNMKKSVSVYSISNGTSSQVTLDRTITAMCIDGNHAILSDGFVVEIYKLTESKTLEKIGGFKMSSTAMAIQGTNIFFTDSNRIQVRTLQGVIKQFVPLPDSEGDAIRFAIGGQRLCVATKSGSLRIYDNRKNELKMEYKLNFVAMLCETFESIKTTSINCAGCCCSFTISKFIFIIFPAKFIQTDKSSDACIYVWDALSDKVHFFDFQTCTSGKLRPKQKKSYTNHRKQFPENFCSGYPVEHLWDGIDCRMLLCQIVASSIPSDILSISSPCENCSLIAIFFVHSELDMLLQRIILLSSEFDTLIASRMPYYFFVTKECNALDDDNSALCVDDDAKKVDELLIRLTQREFIGLENCDSESKAAILDFSMHLAAENTEEALKAIRSIKTTTVWKNVAKMCIRCRRLDVAMFCLRKIGNARIIRNIRHARQSITQTEALLGILAIHLGLTNLAIEFFHSSGRYDLLNQLYQDLGNWEEVAQSLNMQIYMENICKKQGNYTKQLNNNFEKASVEAIEIPHLITESVSQLEAYVQQKQTKYTLDWWAQFLESRGQLDEAMKAYTKANDICSVIRILCHQGNTKEAINLAETTNDRSAYYQLARHFESTNAKDQALQFFISAEAYISAIRLCKECGYETKMAELALKGSKSTMEDVAHYFECQSGKADVAVMLYCRAGIYKKALDLAFRTEQLSALNLITAGLEGSQDLTMIEKCAQLLIKNQQYTKAVELLAHANQYEKAIQICMENNATLTDNLVKLLTPKEENMKSSSERKKLLEQLADCCVRQGLYNSAAKKFIQSGCKIKAMKALIKSDDVEKVIFFANTARNKELYIIAGNYLQSLNWKQNVKVVEQIVRYYKKAQAHQQLISFYYIWAQTEIQENGNYEKAVEILRECLSIFHQQASSVHGIEEKLISIQSHVESIEQFLHLKKLYKVNQTEAIHFLEEMLRNEKKLIIRLGDIYSLIIGYHLRQDSVEEVEHHLHQWLTKEPKEQLDRYLEPKLYDKLLQMEQHYHTVSEKDAQVQQVNDDFISEISNK